MTSEELMEQLREAFELETEERLASMSAQLIDMEKSGTPEGQRPLLEVVYRDAHSLKGSARAVDLTHVESLCQALESMLSAAKDSGDLVDAERVELCHECVRLVEDIVAAGDERRYADAVDTLVARVHAQSDNVTEETPPRARRYESARLPEKAGFGEVSQDTCRGDADDRPPPQSATTQAASPAVAGGSVCEPGKPVAPRTRRDASQTGVRVASDKLDALLRRSEELVAVKVMLREQLAGMTALLRASLDRQERRHVDEDTRLLRRFLDQEQRRGRNTAQLMALDRVLAYLEQEDEQVDSVERRFRTAVTRIEQERRQVERALDDVSDGVKDIAMLPFRALFAVLPRMVRDISRREGKEVDLALEGESIEIDRRILDELRDVLTHLIRNAVDHGVESPEEREAAGKERVGTVRVAARRPEGGNIEVIVADDGRGFDTARLRQAAVASGGMSDEDLDRMNQEQIERLVFEPGLSTSGMITEISGRGLGMSIVRERIERLGGRLECRSETGRGVLTRMVLPATLATFRGVVVTCRRQSCVVPASHFVQAFCATPERLTRIGDHMAVHFRGQALELVPLGEVLDIARREDDDRNSDLRAVIVLGVGEQLMAFGVDAVRGEREVLVKPLGAQLRRVRNVSAGTVLEGSVVPVLNVYDLARNHRASRSHGPTAVMQEEEAPKKLLVVEDSITSRVLLKNILEAAGYGVATAVDGVAGFDALKTDPVDLVVSDVEMPRMDGFEMTARIRADDDLQALPVVLVTSLASQQHRRRGVEVGADAYIVKSHFDHENLLETVKRLA
jgi:two-component system, chemotaxis family, sensor kinase CheA